MTFNTSSLGIAVHPLQVAFSLIISELISFSGYMDEPIRKRLTNADAENIAHRNVHGSMSNILHTQSMLNPSASLLLNPLLVLC